MNNLISGAVSGVMTLAIVLVGFAVVKPTVVINAVTEALGAQSEQLTVGPCIEKEGVRTCYFRQTMNTASTTLCSYKVAATSTVVTAVGSLRVGTSTASLFEWGKSTLPDATTTSLGKAPVANGTPTLVASTTIGAFTGGGDFVNPPFVVAPANYVNLKYGGSLCGAGGTTCNSFVGTCDYVVTQHAR